MAWPGVDGGGWSVDVMDVLSFRLCMGENLMKCRKLMLLTLY